MENFVKPLNMNAGMKDSDSFFICPLDCGSDDYCDTCDGVCRPTIR